LRWQHPSSVSSGGHLLLLLLLLLVAAMVSRLLMVWQARVCREVMASSSSSSSSSRWKQCRLLLLLLLMPGLLLAVQRCGTQLQLSCPYQGQGAGLLHKCSETSPFIWTCPCAARSGVAAGMLCSRRWMLGAGSTFCVIPTQLKGAQLLRQQQQQEAARLCQQPATRGVPSHGLRQQAHPRCRLPAAPG
jgi:hypothetical protein